MNDQGVPGWSARWAPVRDQLADRREELLSLRGKTIVDSWLVWDLQHDKWFTDLPVVFLLDDQRRLEVSWMKFDELSLTWDTIDLDARPTGWVDWPLAWRSQGHDALRAVTGHRINSVSFTEHLFTTQQVTPPPPMGAEWSSVWLVGGLLMSTDAGDLHIFNALDENGLSHGPFQTDQQHRLLPLRQERL